MRLRRHRALCAAGLALALALALLAPCVAAHPYIEGTYEPEDADGVALHVCSRGLQRDVSGVADGTVVFRGIATPESQAYDPQERQRVTGTWYRAGLAACTVGHFVLRFSHNESARDDGGRLVGRFYCDATGALELTVRAQRRDSRTPVRVLCARTEGDAHAPRGQLAAASLHGVWDERRLAVRATRPHAQLVYAYSGTARDPAFGVTLPVYGEGRCYVAGTLCLGTWAMRTGDMQCWRAGIELWYLLTPNTSGRLWWATGAAPNRSLLHNPHYHGIGLQFSSSFLIIVSHRFTSRISSHDHRIAQQDGRCAVRPGREPACACHLRLRHVHGSCDGSTSVFHRCCCCRHCATVAAALVLTS